MLSDFLRKVKANADFRIKLFLLLSLIFNLSYSIFLFILSQVYFSKWFLVTSIYHALLSFARLFMFLQTVIEKQEQKQILIMRDCGYYLLLLNLVVAVMMFILIRTTPPVKHHQITVITIATYTFYTLAIAIISSLKQLKSNNHVYFSVKVISLVSASVSMVTLTNTMLATFGENQTLLRSIILPILSGAVSIFIILCAIFIIIKANFDLRMMKNEEK